MFHSPCVLRLSGYPLWCHRQSWIPTTRAKGQRSETPFSTHFIDKACGTHRRPAKGLPFEWSEPSGSETEGRKREAA